MKMESDFETILDVALGGPEIGPLNLSILHGLLREVFQKFDLTSKKITIEEENPDFSNAFNFIKSKVDEKNARPKTSGGGYNRLRSKVSVIVADYARTAVGQPNEDIKPSLLPADTEDRLRYLESELKIVKNFPTVDELRGWAQENTSPDTVVTDLWHFVSLSHRMNGAEEGIQKLTELVDKLIPELKKLTDGQTKLQGQIDDLYSQFHGLSDRATRTDDRINNAGNTAEEKVNQIVDKMDELGSKMNGYAKLMDLEDFVLKDTFADAQAKANTMADQFNEELATKAPISMLDDLVDQGEIQRLKDWVNTLRSQMENVPTKDDLSHLDLYVKWPQLEDALFHYPSRLSKQTSRSSSMNDSQNGSIQNGYGQNGYSQNSNRKKSSIQNGDIKNGRNGSISNDYNQIGFEQNGYNQDDRSSQNSSPPDSRPGSRSSKRRSTSSRKLYPTDACIQKLNELGSMADRQNALMDALERTREQLADKADKSELSNFVTQEDLNDLLLLLKNLQEEVNGLQAWRTIVDDEKVPALRDLLSDLEQQVADLLDHLAHLQDEDKSKTKALENLFTYVDRLEANKLDKDDPLLQEHKYAANKNLPPILTPSSKENANNNKFNTESLDKQDGTSDKQDNNLANQGEYDNDIKKLNDLIKKLQDKINNMEISYDKSLNDILNELDDKLDRAELQPLREYLENRYNTLSQQQQQEPSSPSCSTPHKPHKPKSKSSNADYDPSFTHNIPTDLIRKPVSGGKTYKSKSAPTSKQPSRMSGVYYDNDMLGCSHPHYGDGGFVPLKKNAAVMRSQMKFNCLSCDRPLTMQADSHFQTVRGKDRQLTGYELDQLKLLQRILKGDNPNKATRACGGRHTSSIPPSSAKKLTPKFNSTFPSVNTDYIVATDDLVDNEIDIEGLDGRFYRGLLSRKDIPSNHDRSRSANANLRTVSPSPKRGTDRPISGMDCNSSFTSGLGTTHGSMDIHIH